MTSFDMPVLLLAWRRPDTTRQVIDAIRAVAPTRLFVACDGPRAGRPEEAIAVRACRELIDRAVDWPCTVERLYRDANRGCRRGVSEAIGWFFERVDEGIVLEDDCVPHVDFFQYCAELLERYRRDERVWCISGDNFQDGRWRGDGSYYFSRYNHVWGWASWRRAWTHYDADLHEWPGFKLSGRVATIFDDPIEASYWSDIWEQMWRQRGPDTWDYQWTFACMSNGGLTALPNRNLVRNIGFGSDATNTRDESHYGRQEVAGILPLTRPAAVERHREADAYTFDHHFHGAKFRRDRSVLHRLLTRAQTAMRHPLHYPLKVWRWITR